MVGLPFSREVAALRGNHYLFEQVIPSNHFPQICDLHHSTRVTRQARVTRRPSIGVRYSDNWLNS